MMDIKDKLNIATEFSDHPGARYRTDGDWSGQRFLEDYLLPRFEKAVVGKYILQINLDKVYGYPSSFVSGSFGKLSQMKGAKLVLEHLSFISDENPLRLERIINEIRDPDRKNNESRLN